MHKAYFPDARSYWTAYVDRKGGAKAISDATGIPYSTLACVTNGYRGIGRRLAERLEASSAGELDAGRLIWVTPSRVKTEVS